MAAPRKRPEQHTRIAIGKRFPAAPRKTLCGSIYIFIACELCQQTVWSLAANTRAVCNRCVGPFVAADTDGQHPIDPVQYRD